MNKKGIFDAYFVFIFAAFIMIMVAVFVVPFAIRMNTELFDVGYTLVSESNDTISSIQDSDMKTQITASLNSALQAKAENIDILAQFWRYSWIIVIAVVFIILFMYARQRVEYSTGGEYR